MGEQPFAVFQLALPARPHQRRLAAVGPVVHIREVFQKEHGRGQETCRNSTVAGKYTNNWKKWRLCLANSFWIWVIFPMFGYEWGNFWGWDSFQAPKFVASEVLVDANAILNVYVMSFWLYQTLDIFSYEVGEGRMPEILSRYQRDTVKANSWEMTILNSKSHDETWSFGDDVHCHIGLSGNRRINLEMRINTWKCSQQSNKTGIFLKLKSVNRSQTNS